MHCLSRLHSCEEGREQDGKLENPGRINGNSGYLKKKIVDQAEKLLLSENFRVDCQDERRLTLMEGGGIITSQRCFFKFLQKTGHERDKLSSLLLKCERKDEKKKGHRQSVASLGAGRHDRTTFHAQQCRKTTVLAGISRGFGLIWKAKA